MSRSNKNTWFNLMIPDTRLLESYCEAATWGMLNYSAFHRHSLSDDISFDILRISPHIRSRSTVILGEEAHWRGLPLLR